MVETKIATYRQSGWLEIATGNILVVYGNEIPYEANPAYSKVWDNDITDTTTTIPHVIVP